MAESCRDAFAEVSDVGRCFNIDGVFPILNRVICESYHDPDLIRFLTHHEIVSALLADAEAQQEIKRARSRCPSFSEEWLAHNMVAWFSQKITECLEGDAERAAYMLDYIDNFEREQIDGAWAYRLRP